VGGEKGYTDYTFASRKRNKVNTLRIRGLASFMRSVTYLYALQFVIEKT